MIIGYQVRDVNGNLFGERPENHVLTETTAMQELANAKKFKPDDNFSMHCILQGEIEQPLFQSLVGVDTVAFNLKNSPLFKLTLSNAVEAVETSANDANVSPKGFILDDCMCDCGEIDTSNVASIIDEFAGLFGEYNTYNYSYVVDLCCDTLNEHFEQ